MSILYKEELAPYIEEKIAQLKHQMEVHESNASTIPLCPGSYGDVAIGEIAALRKLATDFEIELDEKKIKKRVYVKWNSRNWI